MTFSDLTCAVVGSINVDWVCPVPALPAAGETVLGGPLERIPGGKGANQAVAAARLGAQVHFFGAVGADADGDFSLEQLAHEGIDISGIERKPLATGIAMIGVAADGENTIIVSSGANQAVTAPHQLDHDVLLLQLEIPQPVVLAAAQRAGGLVCLNAAPASPLAEETWRYCDLLVVNDGEWQSYGQRKDLPLVAVTHGASGASLWRNGDLVARSGVPTVEVVDAVGAGDTFAATLALALASGLDDQQALRWACAAGSLATTAPGARTAMPSLELVQNIAKTIP